MSHASRSKKSKGIREPNLRQFLAKKLKSQSASCSSHGDTSTPSNDTSQNLQNDTNLDGSSANCVSLEDEELAYDVEVLPHDSRKTINNMDYVRGDAIHPFKNFSQP